MHQVRARHLARGIAVAHGALGRRAHALQESGDVGRWSAGIDHQDEGKVGGARDRREVLDRGVAQLLVEPGIGRVRRTGAQQQRIAVRWRTAHDLGRHRTIGAGLVLDHDRGSQALVHVLHQHPRHDVGAAARGERHDHADRLGRIGLRGRERAVERQPAQGQPPDGESEVLHVFSPCGLACAINRNGAGPVLFPR
ncbi:hypothetical protein D3C78_1138630 [compost metagenome]